ncbi:hypothetical protein F6X42_02190 [Paraburkholderia sp. WC7.3b]|uniref:Uncharacterized protein n=1 Tax=Paraburkholderia podalyriae TaxID=1938811 RepID=A0ABR7PGJ2_9BURK|nr:hypothetical protein [Paraburkholderia podalyriae]
MAFPVALATTLRAMRSARQRTDFRPSNAHIDSAVRGLHVFLLQAQLLLFRKNHWASEQSGIELKCFVRFLVQCGGRMKRRSARQLVRILSDLRHAAHCSSLRAAATNRVMALAAAEAAEDVDPTRDDDSPESARDAQRDKLFRGRS